MLYAVTVRGSLPAVDIPLLPGDEELRLDLQAIVQRVYNRAGYRYRLDYRQDPVPPLSAEDAAWADELLRSKGLR